MLERDFKKKHQEELQSMGWIFIQLVADSGVPMGFPDTACISPSGYTCYVEWKKSKNAKRQPLQEYWNARLKDMGHDAFFVYPENVEKWKIEVLSKGGFNG